MKTTVNHWMRVLELIGKGWTQGYLAEDEEGESTDPCSPRATCWCLDGAIVAAAGDFPVGKLYLKLSAEADTVWKAQFVTPGNLMRSFQTHRDYIDWQDDPERTQEEVFDFVATIIERKLISAT